MTPITEIVLVLMLLKLLQMEQSDMINMKLSKSNTIILNGDNNQENIQYIIAIGYYTCIIISLEIVLSKKFKKKIFN